MRFAYFFAELEPSPKISKHYAFQPRTYKHSPPTKRPI